MYSNCKKLKKLQVNSLYNIEKWIMKDCNCAKCQETNQNMIIDISKIKLKQHPKMNHESLLLTNKMIIKIQLEITKCKCLLKHGII
jgi:hypothetical protein